MARSVIDWCRQRVLLLDHTFVLLPLLAPAVPPPLFGGGFLRRRYGHNQRRVTTVVEDVSQDTHEQYVSDRRT